MDPSVSEHDPLALLADEFLERCRRGERLSPEDYARLHPELASQIREVFPALLVMENLGGGCDLAPESPPTPCPPRLGEYRILREVGRGGMGVVYEAVQETLGRHVALKVLPALAAAQGTYVERFRREAKAAARLHHTHIVPVFGVGEHEGTHFYAMQFIHGQGLDLVLDDVRRLRVPSAEQPAPPSASLAQSLLTACYQPAERVDGSDPVPTKPDKALSHSSALTGGVDHYHLEVARLGAQAAEALAYAHSQGVLHRDIKPSNLLLDAEGAIWVTDFGLAKADDSEDLTNTGDIVGTLRYLAPERFDGKGDARSDVYGLGVTLFEMLALRPAFDERDRPALIRRITQEGAPRLRPLAPSVPRDLQTVVEKAAARDPADRYQNAAELAEDLRRVLADHPIRARRQRITERMRRWARRNPALASLGAVVAVLLAVLFGGGIVHNLLLKKALQDEAEQRGRAEGAEREVRLKLFEARVAEARASRHSRRVGQRFRTLEAIREAVRLARELELPAERFDELRNLAIAALALPDLKPDSAWVSLPDDMTEMWNWGTGGEVSPDGRLTAFADRHGAVRVQRVTSGPEKGEVVARLKGLGREVSCGWSSDSRYLAVWHGAPGQLQVWRTDDFTLALDVTGANSLNPVFSPDGRSLIACGVASIRVYDLASGKVVRSLPSQRLAEQTIAAGHVAHHPHRPQLAIANSTSVAVIDLETGNEMVRLPLTQRKYLAWHPHGELLGVAFHDRVEIWDVARKRRNHLFRHYGQALRIYFNQTGDLLAVNGWSSLVRLWNPYSGREVLTTSGLTAGFRAGDRLTSLFQNESSPRQSPLTVVEPARECRTLVAGVGLPGERHHGGCCVHPAGRLLAVATAEGVGLIDLVTGSERGFLPLNVLVLFEPEGSLLTKSSVGLFRWPVLVEGDRLRIGPPQRIPVPARSDTVARSADGEVLAASTFEGAYVWHRDRPREARLIGPHPDCRHLTVSPDGKLVATGSWNAEGIKVWESDSGKLVRSLIPTTPQTSPVFSPDGKWLSNWKGQCWKVSDWTEGPKPSAGAKYVTFSPDGRLAAWGGKGYVLLVEPDTGRELARLEDPSHAGYHALEFTPNGTTLIATTPDNSCVRVWDLRLIRKGLVELGLDWAAPLYPPATELPPDRPLQVEVVGAHLLGDPSNPAESMRQQAIASLYFNPFDAEAHEVLGRDLYARGKYAEAVAHLGAAGAFQHHQNSVWYLRGVAAYRLSRWKEAREDFTRHLNWRPEDAAAFHWRGMAQQQLGEHRLAIADLTEALRLGAKNTAYVHELRANSRSALKQHAGAADDFEAALKSQPDNVRILLPLAVLRANGPEGVRDVPAAVRHAERVVKLQPQDAVCHRVLGIALYRTKKYDEASESLRKSVELGKGKSPPIAALYFLAMCQAANGDLDAAKKSFAEAKAEPIDQAWASSFRDRLKEIREEAEQVLRSASEK